MLDCFHLALNQYTEFFHFHQHQNQLHNHHLDPNVNYIVMFVAPDGFELSPADQGGDDTADSDADENGKSPCTDLEPGENNTTLDAGIFLPCDINPEVTASSDTICVGEEVTLTATGGDQFVWEADGVVIANETSSTLVILSLIHI